MAIAIVVGVAIGSAIAVYTSTLPQGQTSPPPSQYWATFEGSEPSVRQTVEAMPGGPWNLTFAQGVAASGPWSTPATWISLPWNGGANATIDTCLSDVDGVSVISPWNNSLYPVVVSSNLFPSGAAPLWTYIFQGVSGARAVVSWFAGTVVVNDFVPAGSPCALLFPQIRSGTFDPSRVVDSSVAAQAALKMGGSSFVSNATPATAVYVLGSPYLDWSGGPLRGWTVEYGSCGVPGSFGRTFSWHDFFVNFTTGESSLGGYGGGPCFRSLFDMHLHSVVNQTFAGGTGYSWEWNESTYFLTSQVPATLQLTELSTAFFGLRLYSNGSLPFTVPVPSAAAVCTPAHSGLTNCTPPAHGWYGVLLSPDNSWLDSFPATANGTSWTVAGVPVSNGDRLLLVAAPGSFTYAQFGTSSSFDPWVASGSGVEEPG